MRRLAAAVLAALVIGACGGGDGDVSGDAQRALEPHIAEIRLAAAARNASQLRTDLSELRDAVGVLLTEGELSEAGAANIRREVDAVEQQIAQITTTTVARRSSPTTRAREERKDESKEEKKQEERDEGAGDGDGGGPPATAAPDTGGDPGADAGGDGGD